MSRAALLVLLFAASLAAEEPLPPGAVARIGSTRMRHTAEVGTLAYSSDGKLLASADDSGDVHVYDATTGALVRRLDANPPPRTTRRPAAGGGEEISEEIHVGATEVAMSFSADGRHLYAGARETVTAFRLDTGAVVFRRWLGGKVLAIAPDLTVAVVGRLLNIHQLDSADGRDRKHHVIDGTSPPRAEITARGVLSSGQVVARLFDPVNGTRHGTWDWIHAGELAGAAMSPVAQTLAVLIKPRDSERTSLVLWDARDPMKYRTVPGVSGAGPFGYAPDGKSIAVACREGLLLVDAAEGKVIRAAEGAPHLQCLAFSPNGKVIAGASGGAVSQWEVTTGRRLAATAEPAGDVAVLQFGAARLRVYAGTIEDYDWRTGTLQKRYPVPPHTHPVGDHVSPDGAVIAICDKNAVRLIDATTGRVRHEVTTGGHDCIFSPDGTKLYILGGRTCKVVDVRTGKITQMVESWIMFVLASSLSPDGRLLAGRWPLGGPENPESNVIRVWDSRTGQKFRDLAGTYSDIGQPGFSHGDGRWIAAMSSMPEDEGRGQTGLLVWETSTGRLVRRLRNLGFMTASLTLSPDGRCAAFGAHDGAVHVWEIAGGVERITFKGQNSEITALHFSPCGRYLATGSRDVPVLVWDLFAPTPEPTPPLAKLLANLADDRLAFTAMRRLVAMPEAAISLIREQVRPVAPLKEERLKQLLADLDDSRYAKRNAAVIELRRIADQAAAEFVKHAAAPTTSPEARGRLRRLLEQVDEPDADFRARVRALEALERIDTPAARKLIEEYAAGAPGARFTREARGVLERMKPEKQR